MSFWGFIQRCEDFRGAGAYLRMKSPTQTNRKYGNHKEMLFIQGKSQRSMLCSYIGSERFSPPGNDAPNGSPAWEITMILLVRILCIELVGWNKLVVKV